MKKRPRENSDGSSGSTSEATCSSNLHASIPTTHSPQDTHADTSFDCETLDITRILGWGGQATVWQADEHDKQSRHTSEDNVVAIEGEQTKSYAIKAFPHGRTDTERACRERRALQAVAGCPFVVSLAGTFKAAATSPDFQTSSYLCLCLELLPFDLYELIDTHGQLDEGDARFYAACVVLAIQHIHLRGWAYRDLKPENILIDAHGYPKLTDFGCASPITKRRQLPIGTISYMSPQARQGDGGSAGDWWSLGVLIHEMLTADVPFYDPNPQFYTIGEPGTNGSTSRLVDAYPLNVELGQVDSTPVDLMKPALKGELNLAADATSLVSGLLTEDEAHRLGCAQTGGPASVRSHSWFSSVDWEALLHRRVEPPMTHASTRDIRRPAERGAPHHVTKLGKPTRPFSAWDFATT